MYTSYQSPEQMLPELRKGPMTDVHYYSFVLTEKIANRHEMVPKQAGKFYLRTLKRHTNLNWTRRCMSHLRSSLVPDIALRSETFCGRNFYLKNYIISSYCEIIYALKFKYDNQYISLFLVLTIFNHTT